MENRWGNNGNSGWLLFSWAPKSLWTDCSHEIKRCLLLGRKVMMNLNGILKSRDITLPTKFRTVTAMVFPVVMYWCEKWTIKKLSAEELMLLNCGAGRRLLRVTWTARRSNKPILKEINPEYSLEGLMLKLKFQYFAHLMRRADSLEKTLVVGKIDSKRKRGQQMLDDIIDSCPSSWTWVWANSQR